MHQEYSSLSLLLTQLCNKRGFHICIHDIAGISKLFDLKWENKIHSIPFCDAAKATHRGYRLCISCKTLANKMAINSKKPFEGICPYGLYEAVLPVVVDGNVLCVIYVGNMIVNEKETLCRLRKSAGHTGVSVATLEGNLSHAERVSNSHEALTIAQLIDSYIRLLLKTGTPSEKNKISCGNWKIREIQEYIHKNFTQNISLKQLSNLYFLNAKYLGRIFKQETGLSVREYINNQRLEKAKRLLLDTKKTVLDISMECGFENVTYFNRCFMNRLGITPSTFRAQNSKKSSN